MGGDDDDQSDNDDVDSVVMVNVYVVMMEVPIFYVVVYVGVVLYVLVVQ